MSIKRYEVSDALLLPGKVSDPGRTAVDNRLFVNGVFWVLRSGARWSDLPERYGKYSRCTNVSPAGRRPMRFILTGGNASDTSFAIPLIIPQRSCIPRQRAFGPIIYRLRNRIERTLARLKQRRRIATR
jgi:transposase